MSTLIKVIVTFLIIIFTLWGFLWYMAKPVNDFCNGLDDTDDYKTVILKAKSFGYKTYDLREKTGQVKLISQNKSFLRFTCVISFKDENITEKEVLLED